MFIADRRPTVAAAHPDMKATEVMKLVAEDWQRLEKDKKDVCVPLRSISLGFAHHSIAGVCMGVAAQVYKSEAKKKQEEYREAMDDYQRKRRRVEDGGANGEEEDEDNDDEDGDEGSDEDEDDMEDEEEDNDVGKKKGKGKKVRACSAPFRLAETLMQNDAPSSPTPTGGFMRLLMTGGQ